MIRPSMDSSSSRNYLYAGTCIIKSPFQKRRKCKRTSCAYSYCISLFSMNYIHCVRKSFLENIFTSPNALFLSTLDNEIQFCPMSGFFYCTYLRKSHLLLLNSGINKVFKNSERCKILGVLF